MEEELSQIKKSGIKTEWGRIYPLNGRLYLKWYYKGKDLMRALDCKESQVSIAKRNASGVRRKAEIEFDEKAKALGDNPVQVPQKVLAKVWDKESINEYLDYYYGPADSSLNTRYDTQKILKLYFYKLADDLNKKTEELTFEDISREQLKISYSSLKVAGTSDKVLQKVKVALKKFLNYQIDISRNLPKTFKDANGKDHIIEYVADIKAPKTAKIINARKNLLKEEIWSPDEFQVMIDAFKDQKECKACKEGTCFPPDHKTETCIECKKGTCKASIHRHIRPLDYEIYWIIRHMGLPPSDIYDLTPKDFQIDKEGDFLLNKERAKNSEDGDKLGTYYQVIDKGLPEDQETLRIIKERIKEVKKSGQKRLFEQTQLVTRARNDSQDERTRWVSNLSGRRIALQNALKMPSKQIKALRATFFDFWYNKGVPLDILKKWAGHSPGSTMIINLYSTNESTPKFKLKQA